MSTPWSVAWKKYQHIGNNVNSNVLRLIYATCFVLAFQGCTTIELFPVPNVTSEEPAKISFIRHKTFLTNTRAVLSLNGNDVGLIGWHTILDLKLDPGEYEFGIRAKGSLSEFKESFLLSPNEVKDILLVPQGFNVIEIVIPGYPMVHDYWEFEVLVEGEIEQYRNQYETRSI